METTLAQVAHDVLGIDSRKIRVVHGDTGAHALLDRHLCLALHGHGGRRGREACEALIAAHARDRRASHAVRRRSRALRERRVVGPRQRSGRRDRAAWYRRPQDLPPDVDPGGLEATAGYKPKVDTGAFSYAAHAAVVAVDPDTGAVEILDYVIVEDCGTLVNPMVVDGQIMAASRRASAPRSTRRCPTTPTASRSPRRFADYLLPGPDRGAADAHLHMETPSPYTEFGIKGIGEGGAIAPPAAIFNAVNDALAPLGVELAQTPLTPSRVLEAIQHARPALAAEPAAL